MKVSFFATLRPIVGAKTVDMALPDGTTVAGLIEEIVTRYPPLRPELLDEAGQLWPHVHVMVNGRDSHYLAQGLATIIQPADTINVFPAVGGG
jgi:molybdopterin synthase sulfur carrier subunit